MKKFTYFAKSMKSILTIPLIVSSVTYCPTKIVAQTQPVESNQTKTGHKQKQTRPPVFVLPKNPPGLSSVSGHSVGMASRDNCPAVVTPLTAIVPSQKGVGGLTTSQRPTFWFYVPYTKELAKSMEFSLQDDKGDDIYRENALALPEKPSVIGVIPSTVVPLQVGKTYRWYLKLRCNQQQAESVPIYVTGYIQRVNLDSSVMQQLQAADPQQKVAIYAQFGYWFDSLDMLAQERLANPSNPSLAADWRILLQSVQLDNVAQAPLHSMPR